MDLNRWAKIEQIGAKVLPFAPLEVQDWAKTIGGVKDTIFCTFNPLFSLDPNTQVKAKV